MEDIISWIVAFLLLTTAVTLSVKRIWLPYSKFLMAFSIYLVLINILLLFNLPGWISNIGFGVGFLVFPLLDGITTRIALKKYGAREANPIMAWLIRKIGINVATTIPFLVFLVLVLLFWQQLDSSTLFALIIGYTAVIINNVVVIQRNKRRLKPEQR